MSICSRVPAIVGKLIGALVLTVAITGILSAQVEQPFRFEHEQKNFDDYFTLISMKERGIALFREMDKYNQRNKVWQVVYLDTTLKETAKLEIEIKEHYQLLGYETGADRLYLLFRAGETTKNDIELIEVSSTGEELRRYQIKPNLDFNLTHFIKTADNFVFGGYVSNEAVILLFDPYTEGIKVIPGFFQKDTELVDLRTNQNETFNTVLIGRGSRGDRNLIFRTFDAAGKQLLEDVIAIDEDIALQTGISSALEREDLLVVGTWGEKNAKQAQGFYSITVDPFREQKIRFTDFGQLEHFVDFMNEKRAARVKENSRENREQGKKPSFSTYVMPFRLNESPSGYFMLAEVYSQTGSNGMNYANPYYYNPMGYGMYPYSGGYYYPGMNRMYRPYSYGPTSKSSSDVKTLATVVLALDGLGNIKWDQSIKLEEINLPGLEQVGDFVVHDNKVFLVYKKESELKVKSVAFGEGEDSSAEITQEIKTADDQDDIRSEKELEGGVRHWFGNSFYVWGYQTIRNTTKQERLRDVFYINRIDTY
jgi:hypothetical protein